MKNFAFAPSAQSRLFSMLTTEQQANIADEDYFLEIAFAALTEYDMAVKSSTSIINPLI